MHILAPPQALAVTDHVTVNVLLIVLGCPIVLGTVAAIALVWNRAYFQKPAPRPARPPAPPQVVVVEVRHLPAPPTQHALPAAPVVRWEDL